MFAAGRGRIAGKRQLREWAAEMNAELARAFPTLCDNQMAGVLEIKRSPRGGEGVFVRAGHTVPRRTFLGYYPGEIGPQKERDGVHQKYVLGLPEFKVEPGGPDIVLDLDGRPEGGPPFGVEDASAYNNVCGENRGTVWMFWHKLGPGKPQIMIAQAARDLVGGDELTWPYGEGYSMENAEGVARHARNPGSVVPCRCAVTRPCPFQRWMYT